MATLNISLPNSMKTFIEAEVSEGGYSTTSEYFRTLVREAQKRKEEARLESILLEGLRSGDSTLMIEEDWEDIRRGLREHAAKRAKQKVA
jgi:antitoxin ParD1/3/4